MRRTYFIPAVAVFLLTGCIQPDVGSRLSIPYRSQEQFNYCTCASVLMWRLADGYPAVTQTAIYNWMNGFTNQLKVRDAVNYFTATHDAYWDNPRSTDYKAMAARQITAFDRGTPSIVVVRYDHTGVVNGGQWHQDGSFKIWDFVYFHDPDPSYGANFRWAGSDWLDQFCPSSQTYCDQIVSSYATSNWQANLTEYGPSVRVYGGGRDTGPQVY